MEKQAQRADSRMLAVAKGSKEALMVCVELRNYYVNGGADTLGALKPDGRELDPIALLERQNITGDMIPRLYESMGCSPRALAALLVNEGALDPYIQILEHQDALRAKYAPGR